MKEVLITFIICGFLATTFSGMSKEESRKFVSSVAMATQEVVQKDFDLYEKQRNEALASKDPVKEEVAFQVFKQSLANIHQNIENVNSIK